VIVEGPPTLAGPPRLELAARPGHKACWGTIQEKAAMPVTRRELMGLVAAAPALPWAPGNARAQGPAAPAWPSRPIRLVIPFTPAGSTDIVGRLAAELLTPRLGQQVVVENRAGAGGNVGAEHVARSEPDGYTLLLTTIGTGAINFAVFGDRMPYRPEDLAAVGLFTRVPNVLMVHPGLPAQSVAELVALSKSRPGGVNYGTAGFGSSPHVCGELFKLMTGAEMTHVPYRGSAPMLTELIAGRVDVGMDNIPSSLAFVRDGKVRALATTGAARSPVLPEVPTMREAGLAGFEATAWWGILAPAATPRAVVARLGTAVDEVSRDPGFRARLADLGAEPAGLTQAGGSTPEAFDAFLKAERERWAEVVRRSGAKVD
jgi:tripartite-type tricarboxylate transporter receptor subunit TctC